VSAIGVDLGTTFSVVAFNQKKSVRIISDNYGNVLFPSVVSYINPTGRIVPSLGLSFLMMVLDLVVGYEAVRKLESNPQNTIFNSKRFIGRR
jgi:molecular chaperone DnaK (HSP70)